MKRPSPSQSATLYKTGTKKTGNDGNKWIIAKNKNAIKYWKWYTKAVLKKISVSEMYSVPKIKQNNWKKWLKGYSDEVLNSFKKLISLKPQLKAIGVTMEVIGLPISQNNHYFIDWPFNYMRESTQQDGMMVKRLS